jgi:hypothetical protein
MPASQKIPRIRVYRNRNKEKSSFGCRRALPQCPAPLHPPHKSKFPLERTRVQIVVFSEKLESQVSERCLDCSTVDAIFGVTSAALLSLGSLLFPDR